MFNIVDNRLLSCNSDQETITVPEGVEIIESGAFKLCVAATHIILPDSVRVIRSGAFSGASAVQRIDIGKGIETIEAGAFSDKDSWWKAKELHFACPATQPRISPLAGNSGLQWKATVTFPDIGTRAFGGLPMPSDITAKEARELFVAKKSRSIKGWVLDLSTGGAIINNKIREVYRPEIGKLMGQFYEKETDFHVSIPDSIDGCPVEKFSIAMLPPNSILYASPKWFDKASRSVRAATAVAWLEGDPLFSQAEIESIGLFIKKNSADVAEQLLTSKDPAAHVRFGQMVKVKPELVDRLIEAAVGEAEIAAYWMNYKNNAKTKKKGENSLTLDAPKQPTMAAMKKLWTFQTYLSEDGQEVANITRYKGMEPHVVVPDRIGKYKVVEIRTDAFANADHLESIKFENPDIRIGATLKYCPKLADSDGFIILTAGERRVLTDYIGKSTVIRVPEGVTEIRFKAISQIREDFYMSKEPLEVYLPSSVTNFGDWLLLTEHWDNGLVPCDLHVDNPALEVYYGKPSSALTLYAAPGSRAEAFAREYNLQFIAE